ncbi:laccase [Crassisporium funariophilum]|nr:laccase [Crassisporium funariophilum]
MLLPSLFFLSSASQLISGAIAEALGPKANLHIVNSLIKPDGFERSAVLAQGVHPAPLITGKKGDKFHINVVNSLSDATMLRSTSIHWHGIFQHGTTWADGPVGVSQCPIAPNNSFLYEFSVPDQAGTYWYHSHFGTQYCDGLRGPLVVYDPHDPFKSLYDVDDESTIITLGEWYHLQAPSITGAAIADSTLINGKGRYIGGPQVDLAVVNIQHGRRYRFRLVSISCDPNYVFSIDGHPLTIIEVDGENVHPLTVDSIQIFAGQRYSFILNANQTIGNYWIRSLPSSGKNGLASGFTNGTNSAILRYNGAPKSDPGTTQPSQSNLLQETDLHPLIDPQAPGKPHAGGADVNINLVLGFNAGTFTINNHSFVNPTVPVLLQILSGAQNAHDLMPQGSVYPLPLNKVIEITIPGGVLGGPHPFHLHGHSFSVVKSAGNFTKPNYMTPVRRDVVNIGGAGSDVAIRFRTDNSGPWFMHCHIDFHLNAGLAIVFAEDPKDTKVRNPTPEAWKELCPIYNDLPASATSVHLVSTPSPHAV